LWTIHLEGVNVGVRELWVQFARFRGAAVAKGAFRLRPARHLWVGPASLEISGGNLSVGSEALASELRGSIECAVHPFDVRIPVGNEVFRYISARVGLDASGVRLEPARLFLEKPLQPLLRSRPGALRIRAKVDRGRFSESSTLELSTPELALEQGRTLARLKDVRAELRGMPGAGGEARGWWSSAEVHIAGTGAPARTRRVEGFARSSSRDTAASWSTTETGVEVEALELPDLGWLNAAALERTPRFSGALTLSGKARSESGAFEARAQATFSRARARVQELAVLFDGVVDLDLSEAQTSGERAEIGLRIRGKSAGVSRGEHRLLAHGLVLAGRLRADATAARGKLEGTLGRLRGNVGGVDLNGRGALRLNLVRFDRKASGGRGSLTLDFTDVRAARGETSAQAERVELETDFRRSARGVWDAELTSSIQGLVGYTKELVLRAEPTVRGALAAYDPEAERGLLDAALELRDVRVQGREGELGCPNLRVAESAVETRVELHPDGTRSESKVVLSGARFVWDDFRAALGADLAVRSAPLPGAPERSRLEVLARTHGVRLESGPGGSAGWDAEVPELRSRATLEVARDVRGSVTLTSKTAKSRVGRTHVTTALEADLRLSGLDLTRREGHLDGEVRLDDTSVRAGVQSVKNWWARVEVGSALIRAQNNLDISTLFRASLRDATPGLVALSAEDALPSWLVSLLPLRELEVQGTLNRRCRLTDIQFTHAEGGPLEGSGRLQSTSDSVRGAFLVEFADLGAISAGIGFDPKSTRVKLFAGQSWLEERGSALDASVRELLEAPCPPAPNACSAD
jgi:hypothetical protein